MCCYDIPQQQNMDFTKYFVKIQPPVGDKISTPSEEAYITQTIIKKPLVEKKIGSYLIKSESVSETSIDGYTMIYTNGLLIFQGQLVRSKKNGFGIQYNDKERICYEGLYRDDKYDGWGRTPCFTGQFRDGCYDGYGIYSTSTYYYEGFFQKGNPSGQGIAFRGENMVKFHPVKNIYEFLNEGLKNNMNILQKYKIDEIYLGQWKDGTKHGFGRLWKQNYWYSGQFSNDLPHGLGAQETISQKQSKVVQTIYRLGVKK